jgi:hypothetical protein
MAKDGCTDRVNRVQPSSSQMCIRLGELGCQTVNPCEIGRVESVSILSVPAGDLRDFLVLRGRGEGLADAEATYMAAQCVCTTLTGQPWV